MSGVGGHVASGGTHGGKAGSARGWIIGAVAVVLVAALLFFQFRKPGAAGNDAAATTVTIAGIAYPFEGRQVFNGLTGVVIREGWLKSELDKRGVALTFTPVPTAVGGPLINEGFSGKRIDFAAYGDFPAIIAIAGGVPLKMVMPTEPRNTYLVVRNGLSASSIKDLKGKRIALHRGRPWELPFSKLLDANGLKLTDFKIVNINPSATPAALASGNVDAAFLMSDGLLVADKGAGRVIWSTKEAPADWKMRAELFARSAFVDANPALTQLVVDAFVRAAAWSSKPENEAQVIHDASRGFVPERVIRKDYEGENISWRDRFSPLFDPAVAQHYRSVADYTFERGLVRTKADPATLLDDRFVKQALKDLKLDGYWKPEGPQTATAGAGKAQS
jgi:sulfonate transport system substrate-binding protein